MRQLVVSQLAQSDTTSILSGLAANAGNGVAERYTADFELLYERLLAHPESGPPRLALGPHVRIGVLSPYVVIYEYEQDRDLVMILRILHGRQKITGELLALRE